MTLCIVNKFAVLDFLFCRQNFLVSFLISRLRKLGTKYEENVKTKKVY